MPTFKEILFFIERVEGKEQLIRLSQYVAFFINAVCKNSKHMQIAKKAQKFSGNLSIVRKVLRFGMPFRLLFDIYYQNSKYRGHYLRFFKCLFSFIFYISDHLLYMYRVRLITLQKHSKNMQIVDVIRNLSWIVYLIVKILDNIIEIHKVQNKMQKLPTSSNFYNRNHEAHSVFLGLLHQSDILVLSVIRSCLDIPVALYFLDPSKIHPVLVGLLGSVSSIVKIYKILLENRFNK